MNIRHLFTKQGKTKKRIYLDYAAATPVHKEILKKMHHYFGEVYGNPSAIHEEGKNARLAIDEARSNVARTLSIRERDIVFTGNGTEANNLALYGIVRSLHEDHNVPFQDIEIISTKIEHPSISEVLEQLKTTGVTVQYVRVNEEGLIDETHLGELLNSKTKLVTFAYANSEIGVVQQVKRLTRIVRKYNQKHQTDIHVHLDASQAPLWLPCQLDMLGVDLLTLDAGKCYGPKGIGLLAFRHSIKLKGVLLGGGQERGLRAGTENTPLIVGCSEAIMYAQEAYKERSERVAKMQDTLFRSLMDEIDGVVTNGSMEYRIANNINISIPGIDSEFAVVVLDTNGIAASTKSACSGNEGGGSIVVREISDDESRALSTIRFSLGEETTEEDIKRATAILKEHVAKMRATTQEMSNID